MKSSRPSPGAASSSDTEDSDAAEWDAEAAVVSVDRPKATPANARPAAKLAASVTPRSGVTRLMDAPPR
jgi:hypothetical protein